MKGAASEGMSPLLFVRPAGRTHLEAKRFYQRYEFDSLPDHPLTPTPKVDFVTKRSANGIGKTDLLPVSGPGS